MTPVRDRLPSPCNGLRRYGTGSPGSRTVCTARTTSALAERNEFAPGQRLQS